MFLTLKSVAALLAGACMIFIGMGLLNTLVSVRTAQEGYSNILIGGITAAYYVGQLLSGVVAAYLIRLTGHVRAFGALASLISVAAIGHAFLLNAPVWAGFRFVAGFCIAGMWMAVESWLNARATNSNRAQIMAFYMVVTFAGLSGGQFILALGDPAGFKLFAVASILFSLALLPVLLSRAIAPPMDKPARLSFRELYRTSPLGITGAFMAGIILGALFAMGPVFAQGSGMTVAGVATFMGATIIGGLVFQIPIGQASDKFDRRLVMAITGTVLAGISVVLFLGTGWPKLWTFGAAAVWGGFIFPIYSMSVAHLNDYVDPDDLVEASSGLMIAHSLGAVIGPMAAAGLMEVTGNRGVFLATALAGGMLTIFAIYRSFRRASLPVDEQAPFVAVVVQAPHLDPRVDAEWVEERLGTEEPPSG